MKPIELARKLNSCNDAAEFVSQYETIEEAWAACPRGDWMLWTAAKLIDRRLLVGVLGKCARTVQHLMKDPRNIAALDACDKYAAGEISEKDLRAAAAGAAGAAAGAAGAAHAAADGAHDAADAAADARKKNRLQTADICREFLTDAVMAAVMAMNEPETT